MTHDSSRLADEAWAVRQYQQLGAIDLVPKPVRSARVGFRADELDDLEEANDGDQDSSIE